LWPPQRGVGLQEPNLGKTNLRVSHLLICLGFVLRPLLRTRFLLLTLTPACSCVYISKFQFRPIHPPSRRLSPGLSILDVLSYSCVGWYDDESVLLAQFVFLFGLGAPQVFAY
jgi:hypothetical protein